MANPNIIALSTVLGKTSLLACTTAAQDVVANAAASARLYQVKSLYATSITGTGTAAQVTVRLVRGGTTTVHLAKALDVPPGAPLVIISRDAPINLLEDDKIVALADAASHIDITASYEDLA